MTEPVILRSELRHSQEESNVAKRMFAEKFLDNIIGKVDNVTFDGYKKENDIKLAFGWSTYNWVSGLKQLIEGRKFWVRVWPEVYLVGCTEGGVPTTVVRTYLRIIMEN